MRATDRIVDTKRPHPSPWVFLAVGLCVYAIVLWLQPSEITSRIIYAQNDFVQLYAGARLVGSSNLYNNAAVEQIQQEVSGMQSGFIHYIRPPFYAFFLRPLAWIPYRAAYVLFQVINLLCFAWFLARFVPECRELAAFASLSIP